eukprot:15264110-Alexandrium_andersonii.AAC.1
MRDLQLGIFTSQGGLHAIHNPLKPRQRCNPHHSALRPAPSGAKTLLVHKQRNTAFGTQAETQTDTLETQAPSIKTQPKHCELTQTGNSRS